MPTACTKNWSSPDPGDATLRLPDRAGQASTTPPVPGRSLGSKLAMCRCASTRLLLSCEHLITLATARRPCRDEM